MWQTWIPYEWRSTLICGITRQQKNFMQNWKRIRMQSSRLMARALFGTIRPTLGPVSYTHLSLSAFFRKCVSNFPCPFIIYSPCVSAAFFPTGLFFPDTPIYRPLFTLASAGFLASLGTVSYTHLDVYKRQDLAKNTATAVASAPLIPSG